ncbi:hypothetical protein [Kingella oralis]|uniref:hypothetical protein n=1 Tax=Kingella oralis TaxID=505 RepID=UPI003C6FF530
MISGCLLFTTFRQPENGAAAARRHKRQPSNHCLTTKRNPKGSLKPTLVGRVFMPDKQPSHQHQSGNKCPTYPLQQNSA